MDNDSMPRYFPLRAVVQKTGLTAETIRAWERRYSAVTPERSPGGTRLFSQDDIHRLIQLKTLRDRGRGIHDIAQLPTTTLQELVEAEQKQTQSAAPFQLKPSQESYLRSIEILDSAGAREQLDDLAKDLSNVRLLLEQVIPIMWEVGNRWSSGKLGIAQEHLVSYQLRRLILGRLLDIPPARSGPKLLFTTPAGHLHEFGILAGALAAAEVGLDILYLGPNLPTEEIVWSVAQSRADILVLSVVRNMSEQDKQELLRLISTVAPRVPVWVGCPPGHPIVAETDLATFISSIEDFQCNMSQLLAVNQPTK
jgi:DNA-binding transcriptional MerR regulator